MATYIEQSLAKLEEFEGSIPWMYLDTVGKVTVGVGLMLPDAAAAAHLPFRFGDRNATEEEIASEFARVDALPMGRPALYYRRKDAPELDKPAIDSLLRTVLTGFEGELRTSLSGYDGYPDGVKMALLDMAYNLGPAGLLHGYPKLLRAVQAGAWPQAAAARFRHGPGAARNEWTRAMFVQGVLGSVKAEAESGLKRFGYGLIGLCADLWIKATGKK
jgi:GH24 family phage-related lysozyme (muramidase)